MNPVHLALLRTERIYVRRRDERIFPNMIQERLICSKIDVISSTETGERQGRIKA